MKFFLDTNTVIYLLRNNSFVMETITNAEWLGISVITGIEFLSFPNLQASDKGLFKVFLGKVSIVNLEFGNQEIIEKTIQIRKLYKVRLPDAIIAASAIASQSCLLTADSDFKKIKELQSKIIELG